jgi:hypothetical protein
MDTPETQDEAAMTTAKTRLLYQAVELEVF